MLVLSRANMLVARTFGDAEHVLLPAPLSSGDYVVGDSVLSDPAFLDHISALTGIYQTQTFPSGRLAASGEVVVWDGRTAQLFAGRAPWSVQELSVGSVHFELRPGDVGLDSDRGSGRQRAEFSALSDIYPAGVEVWQSWSMELSNREGFEFLGGGGNWAIVAQWHSTAQSDGTNKRSPVIAFDCCNNRFKIITRSSSSMSYGNGVPQVHYDSTLSYGISNIVMNCVFGIYGKIVVWVNGDEIVNSQCPIGYFSDTPYGIAYPQFGIYRKETPTGASVVISNMTWGVSDLSYKINSPYSASSTQ